MKKLGWIDAHTHLTDKRFKDDLDQVIMSIQEHNIIRVNLVGTDVESSLSSLQLASEHPFFDVSIGLHPSSLKDYTVEDKEIMFTLMKDERVISIGEIGLDYHWHDDNKKEQKEAFIEQTKMADSLQKPIMIHTRSALEDTYQVLKSHVPKYGCVMHCYSGDVQTAMKLVDLGFYISIAGPVTFKNGQETRDVVKQVPLDRLLIETDAPYLAPMPYRGKRNDPSLVRFVGEEVARLKNLEITELQAILIDNYETIFKTNILSSA